MFLHALPPGRRAPYIRSVFWLTYCDPSGHVLGVAIQDSGSLVHARLRAAISEADRGARLCQGHELDPVTAKLVPAAAIGRMLKPNEATKLLRKIESQIPKRPPAASVKRRQATRKRG
jgi:hypothetical protein